MKRQYTLEVITVNGEKLIATLDDETTPMMFNFQESVDLFKEYVAQAHQLGYTVVRLIKIVGKKRQLIKETGDNILLFTGNTNGK